MLTRPELESKQLLAIIVEPDRESRLRLRNKNIVYEKDGKVINQCSLSRLLHLMIVGDISITTNLIRDLNSHGVSICLLKNNLMPYAYFGFETQANFLLRSRQYQLTVEQNLHIARAIVSDKIHNQAILLKRISANDGLLDKYIREASMVPDAKTLLGVEGNASKLFFSDYFEMYGWVRRSPRTKEDILNFLLDIGYTVLFNFVDAICRHFGLDTYKGVYHTQFFARKSLVCDLVEPFRCLIDSRTRTALSLKILTPEMFKTGEYGVYSEWKDTSKIIELYAQEVLANRLQVFAHIQGFYKYTMDQSTDLPKYRLKR